MRHSEEGERAQALLSGVVIDHIDDLRERSVWCDNHMLAGFCERLLRSTLRIDEDVALEEHLHAALRHTVSRAVGRRAALPASVEQNERAQTLSERDVVVDDLDREAKS